MYHEKFIIYGKIQSEMILLVEVTAELISFPNMDGRNCCIRIKVTPDTINCCRYALESIQYGDGYPQRFIDGWGPLRT